MPRPLDVAFPPRKERRTDLRREEEHRKLRDEFFDHPTLIAISRLITQGQFEALDRPIATGKEGGVFRASSADGFRAVKVYRISNTVFRNLPPHVVEEFRREASASNFARLVMAWTRREHTLLGRLHDAGVRVPEPRGYLRNVLVMEFVGDAEGLAAPRLIDLAGAWDPEPLYHDLVEQVGRMTRSAHLVHGDLSPYNVLVRDGRLTLIDVAQSMPSDHPQARALLERDLKNFARFFERAGRPSPFEELWAEVGGASVGPRED
ncbi:MAG: serine protein kinase RIO [Thermoplasmata archaeon]